MRFVNQTIHKEIDHAIKDATRLLSTNSSMLDDVRKKDDFEYDSGKGEWIAATLWLYEINPIQILTYRPWNPYTRAIGYWDGRKIHINVRKLSSLDHQDLVGLLLHEWSHKKGFTHGTGPTANYKTEHKCLYSVPYYLSENVEKWL